MTTRSVTSDGLTRRDWMNIGALAPLGLSLTGSSVAKAPGEPAAKDSFGKAKRCILLYLWGSPSQLDTFDPKPDAPEEVRGTLRSIATSMNGVRVGEILPRIAKLLDRTTVLRSLTHPYPVHGMAFATSTVPSTDIPMESDPRDSRHWPFIGSVVDYLADRKGLKAPDIPRNFGLPFPFGSKRGPARSGPFGGFLGPAYDTVWSEFRAKGTREILRDSGAPNTPTPMVADPYFGILPTDRFETFAPAEGMTPDRLNQRASLLEQLDSAKRRLDSGSQPFDRHRELAVSVLTSGKFRDALDVQRESPKARDRYGMTLFGQSCLAARRPLEAGGKFVTVCWDEYGLFNTGWDTHVHLVPRLKDELGPGLDNAFASLLEDLDDRGLLEDTSVVVMSEHGRTPQIQSVAGGGRDHWSRLLGALRRGRVRGRPCRRANRFGRPYAIGGSGRVRTELLA